MRRTDRLFEIIQILRVEQRSITAAEIAARLEVSARTIYRDIQALQAMRTPIEGEAGVGYMMRQGYDLPPLNFNHGDRGLREAAKRVSHKIDSLRGRMESLQASEREALVPQTVEPEIIRAAIREEQKLDLEYSDEKESLSQRRVQPIAIIYYVQSMLLVAWCELRRDFRHFRIDRIRHCVSCEECFRGQGDALRRQWQLLESD